LKEKEVLFVVKKVQNYLHLAGHPFEVTRLTNDEGIVNSYHCVGKNYTPLKVNIYACLFSFSDVLILFRMLL
jgi:hypothetical protein